MKNILVWIRKHKLMTICVCVLIFLLPLMIVHILFKGVAENQWFEATWKAGELLAYIAGFETLLGTVILGMITVYQSDRANEINERLNKENNYLQRISIQQMLPVLKIMDIIVLNTILFFFLQDFFVVFLPI